MIVSLNDRLTQDPPKNGMFYTVAIDGRAGSGKTTLMKYINTLLPELTFINGDDYFEPIENEISWGKFNDERFVADVIKPLKVSNKFIYRPYDWHATPHIKEVPISVSKRICFERSYSFLFDLDWDIKIWVETPKEVCFKRGVARESMPQARAEKAWKEWQDAADDFIAQYQPESRAEVVISGTQPFKQQIN